MASGCHSAASSLARQHYSTERFGRQPSHTINWESGHFTSHVQPEGIPNEHQTVVVQTHRAHITAPDPVAFTWHREPSITESQLSEGQRKRRRPTAIIG